MTLNDGILVGGRGGKGGYGPYSRFGELELLLDARRTVGVEGTVIKRVPDFSAHATNYLTDERFPGFGFGGKVGAIRGAPAFRVMDGFTGQGVLARTLLTRGFVGPMTTVTVCALHNPAANAGIYARGDADTGHDVGLFLITPELVIVGPGDAQLATSGVSITADQPLLIVSVYNGANSLVRLNGVQRAAGTTGSLPNWQSITVGDAFLGGVQMNGYLGLLGFYRGALSTQAILALEDFTNRDWRLGL